MLSVGTNACNRFQDEISPLNVYILNIIIILTRSVPNRTTGIRLLLSKNSTQKTHKTGTRWPIVPSTTRCMYPQACAVRINQRRRPLVPAYREPLTRRSRSPKLRYPLLKLHETTQLVLLPYVLSLDTGSILAGLLAWVQPGGHSLSIYELELRHDRRSELATSRRRKERRLESYSQMSMNMPWFKPKAGLRKHPT
jgi:hypothetical protein